MNTLKRISAIILALVMVLSLGVTVFADETPATTYKITVKQNEHDDAEHTWTAYQIFKGDLAEIDGENILSNIKWGDNVDYTGKKPDAETGKTLLQALKDNETIGSLFATITADVENPDKDAAAIAAALAGATTAQAQVFADVVNAYLTTSTKSVKTTGANDTKEITGLEAGYYLVKDTMEEAEGEHGALSDFILEVVSDVTVTAKTDVPSVDKEIVDDGEEVKANEAAVGETITYRLKSNVPNMKDYKGYWFIYHDILSKGLTFGGESTVTVKVYEPDPNDPTKMKEPANYIELQTEVTVTDAGEDGTKIDIVLKDFYNKCKDKAGWFIVVEYTAELNKDAVIGPAGNPNTVDLEYSNNPNYDYNGDKPGPDDKDVTGKTPESKVVTYTTGLKIIKVDETGKNRLVGAQFTIKGTVNKKYIVERDVFTEDNDDGTYYKLTDGSYTETPPEEATKAKYVNPDGDVKYKKTVEKTVETGTGEYFEVTATVGDDGTLIFEGLADGTYTITEAVAPDGYNLLEDEITLVVESNPTETTCTWTVGTGSTEGWTYNSEENLYEISIKNNKGAQLPSTGGMGTTIFYIVGGIMLLAAMAVCVSKVLSPKVKSTKVATEI